MSTNSAKKMQPQEINTYIRQRFSQYLHSTVVLKRAIKNCQISQINQYLTKRLEQEPKWGNIFNIVYGIITNTDLPKCKFCNKQLPFSAIEEKQIYCSKECQERDTNVVKQTIEVPIEVKEQKKEQIIVKQKKEQVIVEQKKEEVKEQKKEQVIVEQKDTKAVEQKKEDTVQQSKPSIFTKIKNIFKRK